MCLRSRLLPRLALWLATLLSALHLLHEHLEELHELGRHLSALRLGTLLWSHTCHLESRLSQFRSHLADVSLPCTGITV